MINPLVVDMTVTENSIKDIVRHFEKNTGLTNLKIDFDYVIKERADVSYIIFYVANPPERFYRIVNEMTEILKTNFCITIQNRPEQIKERIILPETQLLRRTIVGSLNVGQNTLSEDFFDRYIKTVFQAEDEIISDANHIVYGRRGAGKSSLLVYYMYQLRAKNKPYAWISMQTYSQREDGDLINDILCEIFDQLKDFYIDKDEILTLQNTIAHHPNENINKSDKIVRLLPKIKKIMNKISKTYERVILFIDDLHVIRQSIQPQLLNVLYSISRDNRVYLKISGIEQMTKLWEPSTQRGMQLPHDIQQINLDSNLTMPDKSLKHIHDILNAHALYCGLPNIDYLCAKDVLSRLVWISAGVPRDALYIFMQALTRTTVKDQKRVSITSMNAVASDMINTKLKDIEKDAPDEHKELKVVLERIREFCFKKQGKDNKGTNAFLVEQKHDEHLYQQIAKLVESRFLHLLHDGITPSEAGRRYIALLLDYGFYVGSRTARTVQLFHKNTDEQFTVKELRKLPIFPLE